jgi:hypothetical protein
MRQPPTAVCGANNPACTRNTLKLRSFQNHGVKVGFGRDLLDPPLNCSLRPVGIVTLKNRTLTPVARLLVDCACEVAEPMAMGKSSLARRRQGAEKV